MFVCLCVCAFVRVFLLCSCTCLIIHSFVGLFVRSNCLRVAIFGFRLPRACTHTFSDIGESGSGTLVRIPCSLINLHCEAAGIASA